MFVNPLEVLYKFVLLRNTPEPDPDNTGVGKRQDKIPSYRLSVSTEIFNNFLGAIMLKFLTLLFFAVSVLNAQKKQTKSFTGDTTNVIVPTITVTSNYLQESKVPIVYSEVKREELIRRNTAIDLPTILNDEPSIISYSESGFNIGYSNLTLRGFDQRRISVYINGIPQNDPEDHNVYWINFSDLTSSLNSIQIQRGAGLSNFGSPAIGGSINLATSSMANEPGIRIYQGVGSAINDENSVFSKTNISYSSGIIGDGYSVYAKYGQINSTGYRANSSAFMGNYFISLSKFSENLTSQINIYGGWQDDLLAYSGLPKEYINNSQLRRRNYGSFSYDLSNPSRTISGFDRTNIEKESFAQPHFEILNDWKINEEWSLKSSLFYYTGFGYFDYSGVGWTDNNTFGINSQNGFSDSLPQVDNQIIRSWVVNRHGGWIPHLVNKHKDGTLTIGAELRWHRSEHWGELTQADNIPQGFDNKFKFYYYDGIRNTYSLFARELYDITEKLTTLLDAQLVYQYYGIANDKVGNNFREYYNQDGKRVNNGEAFINTEYLFLNPRIGFNYRFDENFNSFLSIAYTNREPRMANLYDATFAFSGNIPIFNFTEVNQQRRYDFNSPIAKPEQLLDIELSTSYKSSRFSTNANFYYMDFRNELVRNGKLDAFGSPIVGNAPRTLHYGLEVSAKYLLIDSDEQKLNLKGNITQSTNEIIQMNYVESSTYTVDLSGNQIAGFPNTLINLSINYIYNDLSLELQTRYQGGMKSDNFGDLLSKDLVLQKKVGYFDNNVDGFILLNLYANYKLNNLDLFGIKLNGQIQMQLQNVTNAYFTTFAVGKEFFPGAPRMLILGTEFNFN